MAIAEVQHAQNAGTSVSSVTITISPTGTGNCLIVTCCCPINPTLPTSITIGGSASNFTARETFIGHSTLAIWACPNAPSGQTSVVVTLSGTDDPMINVWEFSGLASAPTDQTASNNTAASSWTSTATPATSQPTELAIGIVGAFDTLFSGGGPVLTGPAGPWVNAAQQVQVTYNVTMSGYNILSSTGPVTYSGTSNLSSPDLAYTSIVVTFEAAAATSWSGSYSRTLTKYTAGPPPLLPLAIPVTNTAGNWMFAVVSWRQDYSPVPGVIQQATTVVVSDDADNFWIPVNNGLSNAFGLSDAGVTRPVIWMAPAARAAQHVFISPNGLQAAIIAQIFEIAGDCPWYEIALVESAYVNQGTSVTLTGTAPSGTLMVGCGVLDDLAISAPWTATGWTLELATTTANGSDHSGDLSLSSWTATSAGTALTLSSSWSGDQDGAVAMIAVHGVTDFVAYPYSTPLENWPVLVTEIGSGTTTNSNPLFAQQLTGWSTGIGATTTAVTWPVLDGSLNPDYGAFLPGYVAQVVPGGTFECKLASNLYPVSTTVQYNALAYVYSPLGFGSGGAPLSGSGGYVSIIWYDNTSTLIFETTTTQIEIPAGSWTQLQQSAPVFPPENAAYGQVCVTQYNGGNDVPVSAVYYVGYCAFGPTGAYENLPPDEISWTDVSGLNFTQDAIEVSRGIQYEQQSLEAGTMTITLVNNTGAFIFGNTQSPYWPFAGDTDVPVRLRAIWPLSVTPYYVLFSGFTDQMTFGWDESTWFGYAEIQASDAWSRLTAQLLTALQQEILEDNPVVFITCNLSGANLAPGNTTAAVTTPSQFGAITGTATFSSSAVNLLGGQGLNCWESSGTGVSTALGEGVGLTYFPLGTNPLPPTSGGVTMEFWMSGIAGGTTQPVQVVTLCTCWSGSGPMWSITLDNTGSVNGLASISVYDQATAAVTHTLLTDGVPYLNTVNAPINWFFTVSWTETSLTVGSGISYGNQTTVSCNLAAQPIGFSFGGNAGPLFSFNYGGNTPGFMNVAIADIAVFEGLLPPARLATHWETASLAWNSELDVWRLARVTGYSGATPVALQMRGLDLAVPPGADLDLITAITDTSGQVTSSYFTNIASTTLAFMFVPGTGVMAYRRRLEAYDRASPQWQVGEHAELPINANTLSESASTTGWFTANGATLVTASLPSASPVFEFCGLFHGNGATATPEIGYGSLSATPVTPGAIYQASAVLYSPQGWASGVTLFISWFTSGGSFISDTTVTSPMGPGSLVFLATVPTIAAGGQAPATAAYAQIYVQAAGTPASTVQFYVAEASLVLVPFAVAGGASAVAPEVPYLISAQLSSDRALLFNQAILTQYGTSTAVTYQGSDLVFQPTSGVLVTISNEMSITQRAAVPYTATLYLNNTVQTPPYELNDPSMEDFGNWITQTLATPLLRPESLTITPAATVQATLMALQAEIGDTVTFIRRSLGAPEVVIVTYISKLTHDIDISTGKWETKYELSPFPQGFILACDDVVHGVLDATNSFGW